MAVLRVSGPDAGATLEALTRRALPSPRIASVRRLYEPHGGDLLDEALVLWLPGPASFTGEDVVELHVHGGVAVVSGLIEALQRQPGLRPAEPGEFTRRAFEAGRLDLTQVEGLADLIAAETPAQRQQALQQMGGALAQVYDAWRERLIRVLAYVEADIDFAEDEDDVPEGLSLLVRSDIDDLLEQIAQHLGDNQRGERLREGLTIAVLGPPNAGKSSLINLLSKRDVAIVSPIAGTTRDIIEVHLNLGGYPVTLIDTAGLRETEDPIEAEGVARARARAEVADLRLLLTPAGEKPPTLEGPYGLQGEFWRVHTKIDLVENASARYHNGAYHLSLLSGAGVNTLVEAMTHWAAETLKVGEAPALTRARHRQALEDCTRALAQAGHQRDLVLAAEDLRIAMRALGRITGRVDVEDLLDVIFRDFCIGK